MNNTMEYRGYHAKIEYSAEDGTFIGHVLGINDVLSFDGENVAELEEMFHDNIDDYLELCKELGKEPDKEYKGSFNVRITPELHRAASLKATQCGVSLNQFVSDAIELAMSEKHDIKPNTVYFVSEREKQISWNSSSQPLQNSFLLPRTDRTRMEAYRYAKN